MWWGIAAVAGAALAGNAICLFIQMRMMKHLYERIAGSRWSWEPISYEDDLDQDIASDHPETTHHSISDRFWLQ